MTAAESGLSVAESGELRGRLKELEDTLRATLNILEDFDDEKQRLKMLQRATMNLLEDMDAEKEESDKTQHALLNILEDIEIEREKTEHAKAILESVNKELEAFSYSVSHDLRAPLRAISGFSQAVLEDYFPRLDDEGKRYLRLIQENTHKMGQLIDDLLAFSRLSRQQMTKDRIDMEALARSVFEELAELETNREIQFSVLNPPPIFGDSSMMRQVLSNLIANSIKFTKTKEKATIEFGYLAGPEEVVYYIKDNGVGFDMQYVDKLFGVFQRLHSVKEYEGTGVGLALVHRIIARHGGRVWAEGRLDEGATFYFALPRGL